MLACHAGDPGPIPGQCTLFFSLFLLLTYRLVLATFRRVRRLYMLLLQNFHSWIEERDVGICEARRVNWRTIPNSFIALNTSFIISCGFDCDRIPRCHLAFFNDAAVVFALLLAELTGFRPCGVGGSEWTALFVGLEGLFPAIGSNVTLISFKAEIQTNERRETSCSLTWHFFWVCWSNRRWFLWKREYRECMCKKRIKGNFQTITSSIYRRKNI